MTTAGFRVALTENQSDVLRFLSVKPASVYEMQEQHFRDKTTARLAASANTLADSGLADRFLGRYAITQRGRDWLAEEGAHAMPGAIATAPGPALTIPVETVRSFRELRRAMLRDETKPLGRRDGRWAVKVYALTEMLATILTANGVPGVFVDSPSSVESALRDLFGFRDSDPLPGDENT